MLFIYTTISTRKQAVSLGNKLVKTKLAACVGYWPIQSVYKWKGKMRHKKEYALLIKTAKKRSKQAMKFIRQHHSYELPAIVTIPITDYFLDYKKWVISGE